MKIHTYFAALAVLAGGAYAVIAPTQAPEPEEPTAQHEALMEGVGTFTGTMKMLMPGMEMEMPCTEEVTAFGDFWVVTDFTCSMGPDAVYHGRGTMGYDPRTKEAIGTWIDTTTSHMSMMRGTNDLEKGVTTMDFEMPVETMGGKIMPHRMVSTRGDDGGYSMTMHMEVEGEMTAIWTCDMEKSK